MVIDKKNKEYNKSAVFLLPMLDIRLNLFADFYNVYYKTIYNQKENERIYLVYKSDKINETLVQTITKSNFYISNYSVDGFEVFVYRVPALYLRDFNLFCRGQYNNFSKIYKNLLLVSYGMLKKDELNRILNSTSKHKEELAARFDVNIKDIKEIFPIPDEIEETFSISNNYKLEI